ncbi:MAG: lytic murein transglycosylase [bacterium]|nr:lytic murein transglycosylase [bacterium]
MNKFLKPKVLGDITIPAIRQTYTSRRDSFSLRPGRLNLGYKKIWRIPLTRLLRFVICFVAVLFLILGSATAPTIFIRASTSPVSDAERQALELQLQELEGQIDQYENQITGYQKQGKTLKGEITTLNNKIAKLNLQIQAIGLTLKQLNKNIEETQSQIVVTEGNITTRKAAMGELLQNLYENERVSLVQIFLKNPQLSDFFADLNSITLLQSSLRAEAEKIIDLRDQLKEKRERYSLAKADAESVREYQAAQKTEIDGAKTEKNKLLDVTKGQESKYQSLLKQTKETAAQIRSRIFQLLGGGELSFEKAYSYAKLAGGATGIRPALILAVLDRESALGQNVGRCNYKTAMSPSNQVLFLQIVAEIGINNPDTVTVSCPNRDGVYGGAMGPAQFIPSTWNLYKNAVSKVTGHSPASPWDHSDAFVATALYLKDAMTGCASIYSAGASQERCVAAKYYAGGRWRSYLWTYGEAVVSRARAFQNDIDTITG